MSPTASTRHPAEVLLLLTAFIAMAGVLRQALGVLGPLVVDAYALSAASLGLLASAVALGNVAATYLHGVGVQRLGVRWMLLLGGVTTGLCFLPFLVRPSLAVAATLLFMMGLAFSSVLPVTNAGTFEWFARVGRGLPLGIKQAGVPLGAAVAALTLPYLAARGSWHGAFGIAGAAMVVVALLAFVRYQPGPYAQYARSTERPGTAAAVDPRPASRTGVFGPALLAAVGFTFSALVAAVTTFAVPYLQEARGLSLVEAGAWLAAGQGVSIVARPLLGVFSDRVDKGRRKPQLLGLLAFGVVGMGALASASFTDFALNAPLFALIVGVSLSWSGPVFLLAMEQAPPGRTHSSSSLTILMIRLGALVAPPVFGAMVDAASFEAGFALVALSLALVGIAFAVAYRER